MNAPTRTLHDHSLQVVPQTRRTYEIAALRADDSQHVFQVTGTAFPLLDAAFSAFARGTLLASPEGQIAIEDLQPGDWLETSVGETAQVQWIGSTTFSPAAGSIRSRLVRIMADTFGPARPGSFVTLGPSARILQTPPHLRGFAGGAQILTPVSEFVDMVNIIEVTPPTPVQLFHICLSRHAAVDVGGVETETFHPGTAAARAISHAQRDFFLSLFPRISHLSDFGPLAHPRAPETGEIAA